MNVVPLKKLLDLMLFLLVHPRAVKSWTAWPALNCSEGQGAVDYPSISVITDAQTEAECKAKCENSTSPQCILIVRDINNGNCWLRVGPIDYGACVSDQSYETHSLYPTDAEKSFLEQLEVQGMISRADCNNPAVQCDGDSRLEIVDTSLLPPGAMTGTLPNMENLTRLTRISMVQRNISGTFPFMSNLPSLVKIDFYENHLTGTLPPVFNQLPALEELFVSSNELVGTLPLAGVALGQLKVIHVTENEFGGAFPSISNYPNMVDVFAGRNAFTSFGQSSFAGNQKLVTLGFKNNLLTGTVPPLPPSLESLYLSHNSLSGKLPTLSGLAKMKKFSVHNNLLTSTQPATNCAFCANQAMDLCDMLPNPWQFVSVDFGPFPCNTSAATANPTANPTITPTAIPTAPTATPTAPTANPTPIPTRSPTYRALNSVEWQKFPLYPNVYPGQPVNMLLSINNNAPLNFFSALFQFGVMSGLQWQLSPQASGLAVGGWGEIQGSFSQSSVGSTFVTDATAFNPVSSATEQLTFKVLQLPELSYADTAPVYYQGEAVNANVPFLFEPGLATPVLNSSGMLDTASYSVSPSLLPGLFIDNATGAITGTPSEITSWRLFNVTLIIPGLGPPAFWSIGGWLLSLTAQLNVTVLAASPTASSTAMPSAAPTAVPSAAPTAVPSAAPTAVPSAAPTAVPSAAPTAVPSAAPTAVPSAAPTAVPSAAPTAVDRGCADILNLPQSLVEQGLVPQECMPMQPTPPLPNPDEGGGTVDVVSVIVDIVLVDIDNEEVPISGQDTPIVFEIPLRPSEGGANNSTATTRRIASQKGKCAGTELRCEYYDTSLKRWAGDGCRLVSVDDVKGTCACDHLTSFALILRSYRLEDPTCLAEWPNIASSALYGVVALTALLQYASVSYFECVERCHKKQRLQCAKGQFSLVRAQLLAVLLICVARMIVLLTAHGLYDQPAVIVCLALVPFFLEMGVFGGMAAVWASIGMFLMQKDQAAKLKKLAFLILFVCLVITLAFPLLLLLGSNVDRTYAEGVARAGAYCMAGVVLLVCGGVLAAGCTLVKFIRKTVTSFRQSPSPEGKGSLPSNSSNAAENSTVTKQMQVEKKLIKALLVLGCCFVASAALFVVSVQDSALADNEASLLVPFLYSLFDCAALLTLLKLLNDAVITRRRLLQRNIRHIKSITGTSSKSHSSAFAAQRNSTNSTDSRVMIELAEVKGTSMEEQLPSKTAEGQAVV